MKKINNSADVVDVIRPLIEHRDQEEVFVICVNSASEVRDVSLVALGSEKCVTFPVKAILKKAILNACPHIVVVHTHPGGNPTPSKADIKETDRLHKVCEYIDTSVLDHVIISPERYFSFSDNTVRDIRKTTNGN